MSVVSFHLKDTLYDVPLSISIPPFSLGVPASLLFKVIILSAKFIVSVFTVVVVPETVKLPETIKLPETVGLATNPIFIWLFDTSVSISFVVPAKTKVSVPTTTPSVLGVPTSSLIVKVEDIAAVVAFVILPWASTVITGIDVVEPYDAAVTAVSAKVSVCVCWPDVVVTVPDNPVPAVTVIPVISPPTFVHAVPSYTFNWLEVVL